MKKLIIGLILMTGIAQLYSAQSDILELPYSKKQLKQDFRDKAIPEVLHILEDVLDDIYHMSAQEVQEILQQDLGCINQISAQALLEKMETNPDLLVINVLSEDWYKDCRITGSINVPLKELINTAAQWDRNQEIVVYCALDACDAGAKGYILLRCMGFEHVEDYRGGIQEWFQLGYSVEGPCAASYLHDQ